MKKFLFSLLAANIALTACSKAPDKADSTGNTKVIVDFRAIDITAKSLPDIVDALTKKEITSAALVQLYLNRIDLVDKNGPNLHAVLTLNPEALAEAKQRDQQRAKGIILGALHGVPILLKDNIETKDNIPTTAGASALKYNITGRDSPLVAELRSQGAIILGKTNLSQWANFRSESSMSGWSALGGQVRNPHMLDRNPCGSSSGSGVATAASLAAATVGTETNGSITCPSNANGIVGFKPTVGIISQQYIIPISASQDTAGPMTKTVKGAALMMNAMATSTPKVDYTAALHNHSLKGVRVGVLNFAKGSNAAIIANFDTALADFKAAGATLIHINERPATYENFSEMSYNLLKYEFKEGLNTYLASTSHKQVSTRSLQALIEFNQLNKATELALFDQSIFIASQAMGSLESDAYKTAITKVQKLTREQGIDMLLNEHNVSVLIAPTGPVSPRIDPINGDVWPSWPGYGSHAAIAGYPHATVPMGSVHYLPVGLSFIGGKNTDAQILSYAYGYEQHSKRRLAPQYFKNAEAVPDIAEAMKGNNLK